MRPLRFWTLTCYPNYAIVYRPETDPFHIVHSKSNNRASIIVALRYVTVYGSR